MMYSNQLESLRAHYRDAAFLVFRVLIGALFIAHGAQKLFGAFSDKGPMPLFSLMGAAGIIELVGGLLIAVGLFTSIAAIVSGLEMLVAYFMVHAKMGAWPITNQGELAVLFFAAFLCIAFAGGGKYSLDNALWKK